ncbi:MAG: hypothetical protein ACXVHO_05850 [Methanobacterium sp.]
MLKVEVLEYGYSLENEKHFVKFNISGLEEEQKDKILPIIGNIPLGDIKRFLIEPDSDEGLKILEYFPEGEYPFNKDVPGDDEIKKVEEMVKGFLMQ